MPHHWEEEFNDLRPPVDNRLQGTSSWINLVTKRDRRTPAGWAGNSVAVQPEPIGAALVEIDDPALLPTGFHA